MRNVQPANFNGGVSPGGDCGGSDVEVVDVDDVVVVDMVVDGTVVRSVVFGTVTGGPVVVVHVGCSGCFSHFQAPTSGSRIACTAIKASMARRSESTARRITSAA